MTSNARTRTILTRLAAATAAMALGLGLAACGGDASSDASASSGASATAELPKLTGVTASGKLGEKPEVSFKTPLTTENNAVAILQEGDGADLIDGDRVCIQYTEYSTQTGEEILSTWTNDVPDCSLVFNESNTVANAESATLDQIANTVLAGKKLNTTMAVASYDGNDESQSYIMVLTPVSQSKDLTQAEGTKVTDVPKDLPKVITASDGKPSIDMNGYKGSDKLVSQTLIEGNGAEVTDSTYGVVVNYTGWLLDGTQFDSSWDRGEAVSFPLSGVIEGWQKGLVGHTVGSQVLLIVPPDLGYGDQANGQIPANSTLVFVVDILAKF